MTSLLRMGVSKDIISIALFILIKGLRVMNLVHATMILDTYLRNFEIHLPLWLDTVPGAGNVKINNIVPALRAYNRVEVLSRKQKSVSFYHHNESTAIKF